MVEETIPSLLVFIETFFFFIILFVKLFLLTIGQLVSKRFQTFSISFFSDISH